MRETDRLIYTIFKFEGRYMNIYSILNGGEEWKKKLYQMRKQ
jgi:hypothetical protein